ncbi:MAG: alpha/beta hydrolase [Anaerolineales bacterium]|nr:alpha/beta hydrolase [Anaerolineales bacterium]
MKRITGRQVFNFSLFALVVGAYIFISWARNALPADGTALQALESDERVIVKEDAGLITFEPVDTDFDTGFIFYPGGRVDYRAYAPVLNLIAERGYFVALVPAPLNLAFFNTNAAGQVMDLFPEMEHWVVGGHSLGGVAAASFSERNLSKVKGLVLWASYPSNDALRDSGIQAITIYGTNDMEGDEQINLAGDRLPATAQFITIEGGNHAQFGSYGPQPGDQPATITPEEQWAQAAEITVTFIESLNK